MNKNFNILKEMKQNITVRQYNTNIESLNNNNNKTLFDSKEEYKFLSLYDWSDTQLVITDCKNYTIRRRHLYDYIFKNYYSYVFYIDYIDYVKQVLQIYFMLQTKEQNSKYEYQYVKLRD